MQAQSLVTDVEWELLRYCNVFAAGGPVEQAVGAVTSRRVPSCTVASCTVVLYIVHRVAPVACPYHSQRGAVLRSRFVLHGGVFAAGDDVAGAAGSGAHGRTCQGSQATRTQEAEEAEEGAGGANGVMVASASVPS
jgi:hypothetical protein